MNKNDDIKINEFIENKVNSKNILSLYQIASIYKLASLTKQTFNSIERCFTMLTEKPDFVELEYSLVAKIFASSELYITSELEVFNAGNEWLSYNIEERRGFAEDLLQKVRLPLLSDHALKSLLKQTSCFTTIDACVKIIKEALDNNKNWNR